MERDSRRMNQLPQMMMLAPSSMDNSMMMLMGDATMDSSKQRFNMNIDLRNMSKSVIMEADSTGRQNIERTSTQLSHLEYNSH
jgi:hypothetical protein